MTKRSILLFLGILVLAITASAAPTHGAYQICGPAFHDDGTSECPGAPPTIDVYPHGTTFIDETKLGMTPDGSYLDEQ
jgi:hypothetical protein